MSAVTSGLLLLALAGNWRRARRRLLLVAAALFIAAGLSSAFVMGPAQAAVVGVGYRDIVGESLRVQAALTLGTGVVLAVSLAVPVARAAGSSSAG